MKILDKIKTWKEPALKALKYIKKYRDFIYIALLILGGIILFSQHSKVNTLNAEIKRQENNEKALTEKLTSFTDELGRVNAEKHAYQLTQKELEDSVGVLEHKNREYAAYINANMNISDTVKVETIIVREVDAKVDNGTITLAKNETYGKSSRSFSVDIPYSVDDNILHTKNATYALDQNIFLEGWLERDIKTKETYIHLRTDYPNVSFNSGMGILAEPSKAYERSMRKTNGVGIAVGPNLGMGYDLSNKKIVPTIGLGVTIGYTWTPRWTQW